jgi:membrane protein
MTPRRTSSAPSIPERPPAGAGPAGAGRRARAKLPLRSRALAPLTLVRDTVVEWYEDGGPRLAAALAYYTAFSIAPLLLVLSMLAGPMYREAEYGVLEGVMKLIPGSGGEAVTAWLDALRHQPARGALATIVGGIALVIGAAGVFGQLQEALNTIWNVKLPPDSSVLLEFLKRRFMSLTMILGTAFLLLVSMLLGTALSFVLKTLGAIFPLAAVLLASIHLLFSFALTTTVFALIFKVVPDARVPWHEAWVGGAVTGLLFNLGQALLTWYLANSARLSLYGAFTSVIVFLMWVYYSAQILLLGAEFTQVYARRREAAHGGR